MSTPELPPASSLILFQTEDGQTRVQCRFEEATVWLSQRQLADLYQIGVNTVNYHIRAIYAEKELEPEATIRRYRIVQLEGERQITREVEHYNLPAILAVGFRVRSPRGTQFRQWATSRLNEYLVKGFTMDDERLRNPPGPGVPDYFDELLERIRDIRASERRVYLRVREILALAADYVPSGAETQAVFQVVQNKLHFAATGQTAPELIAARADAAQPNMGLTSWTGGAIRRRDVTVAKNYLSETEIEALNRIVVMFLDYAEDQARRRKQVFLKDWKTKLDDFLRFNDRAVLPNAGKVSRVDADRKATQAYEAFAAQRRAQLEAQGEQDAFGQLEAQGEQDAFGQVEATVKNLPKRRKTRDTKGDPS